MNPSLNPEDLPLRPVSSEALPQVHQSPALPQALLDLEALDDGPAVSWPEPSKTNAAFDVGFNLAPNAPLGAYDRLAQERYGPEVHGMRMAPEALGMNAEARRAHFLASLLPLKEGLDPDPFRTLYLAWSLRGEDLAGRHDNRVADRILCAVSSLDDLPENSAEELRPLVKALLIRGVEYGHNEAFLDDLYSMGRREASSPWKPQVVFDQLPSQGHPALELASELGRSAASPSPSPLAAMAATSDLAWLRCMSAVVNHTHGTGDSVPKSLALKGVGLGIGNRGIGYEPMYGAPGILYEGALKLSASARKQLQDAYSVRTFQFQESLAERAQAVYRDAGPGALEPVIEGLKGSAEERDLHPMEERLHMVALEAMGSVALGAAERLRIDGLPHPPMPEPLPEIFNALYRLSSGPAQQTNGTLAWEALSRVMPRARELGWTWEM